MFRKILLFLLVVLIIIQFIRPARNHSDSQSPNDIALHFTVPDSVQNILKKSCYDCHSNNTVYPWYSNIQPVAWWLQDHINEGKREINFSEFASYAVKKQSKKINTVAGEVRDGGMPLNSYLWIHTDSKLNDAEKATLANWSEALGDSIAAKNNLPLPSKEPRGHGPDGEGR
jgi:hypothetical protein